MLTSKKERFPVEGTYDRRHLHRPTPRPVPNRSQMAKKPVAAAHAASHPTSQPSVSVLAGQPQRRGMDWVQKTVVKKKLVVREVPVEPVVPVAPAVIEPLPEPEPQGPSIAELMAAELAGMPIKAAERIIEEINEDDDDEESAPRPVLQAAPLRSTHAHTAGHHLSEQERELLRRQFKTALTKDSKHVTRKKVVEKVRHHARKAKSPRTIIAVFLFGVILSGAYAMIDSFTINQQARQALAEQAAEAQQQTQQDSTSDSSTSTDTNNQVPGGDASTTPTTKTSSNYSVPADQAKFINIPKLGIHAPVISVGLTKDGAIDTPKNIWEAAWYNGSAKPGQDGATFIDGHSSANGGALFGHLERLANGDTITIQKGDNSTVTYKVVKVAIVDRNNVDMKGILTPYGGATKGLNLITCQGDWIGSEKTLTNRVEVWTVQQ